MKQLVADMKAITHWIEIGNFVQADWLYCMFDRISGLMWIAKAIGELLVTFTELSCKVILAPFLLSLQQCSSSSSEMAFRRVSAE